MGSDSSFAVHKDIRSHTGAIMTLGKGTIISKSTKQKVNAQSLTLQAIKQICLAHSLRIVLTDLLYLIVQFSSTHCQLPVTKQI
jgi:hypothetical protein